MTRPTAKQAVATQLRAMRATLNLSQDELAALLGVSRQRVAYLESGRANPTLRTLRQIVDRCGFDLDVRVS